MPRGRPRTFDLEKTVMQAMLVFWQCGYNGISINELAARIGVSKPALYDAFGGKAGLYIAALELYYHEYGLAAERALFEREKSLRENLLSYFAVNLNRMSNKKLPIGCLLVKASLECVEDNTEIDDFLFFLETQSHKALYKRLEQAAIDCEIMPNSNLDSIAAFIAGQQIALAVFSASNMSRNSAEQVIHIVLNALPWNQT